MAAESHPEPRLKKSAIYFKGICDIIEACGRNNVHEIHFADVSLFRTEAGTFLPTSRKPVTEVEQQLPRRFSNQITVSDEKRVLLDEQRRAIMDDLDNLDLEDPVEADRLAKEAVEKEIDG